MTKELDPISVIKSPHLIGDTLSPAQEVFLRCLWGLPLKYGQHDLYQQATGNSSYTPHEYRESTCICGRRSGKSSRIAANIAVYEALFRQHTVAPGEHAWVVCLAQTKRQANIVFGYILARLERSPSLKAMIVGEPTRDEITLSNGISIGVWPCNYRSVRGLSIVCCIADELAFWYDDASAANPASEVLRAVRPGMASFPNAKLIKISSPFAKSGVVWDDWRDRAKHPEMLTWKLGTREMNPTLAPAFLDEEQRRDPESYEREYGASFYESASAFLPAEYVEACIVRDRIELPPLPTVAYTAALDVAFRGDYFAFSIVHRSGASVIQDFIRSWRGSRSNPVNLSTVLQEITATLRNYGCWKIFGDSFCSEPVRQALKGQGVTFEQATTLGTRAAPIWSSLRTLITSRQMELLDDAATIAELKRLELVVTSGGNQRVEASSGHDDRAVTLALASHQAISQEVASEPWAEVIYGLPDTGPSLSRPHSNSLGGGAPRRGDVEVETDPTTGRTSFWHTL